MSSVLKYETHYNPCLAIQVRYLGQYVFHALVVIINF